MNLNTNVTPEILVAGAIFLVIAAGVVVGPLISVGVLGWPALVGQWGAWFQVYLLLGPIPGGLDTARDRVLQAVRRAMLAPESTDGSALMVGGKKTGPKAAKAAAKTLASKSASKAAKSAAGSALTQSKSSEKTGKKAASAAGKTLGSKSASKAAKSAAGSALAQRPKKKR